MSDSSSSDFDEETNWILDLETALLDNCDFFKLRNICKHRPVPGHLRSDVWKISLNIQNRVDALEGFDDVFDLSNQDILHEHCREFVASLPKDYFPNSIGFISDIESILTHFSRVYKVEYIENNGWLSILRVLCCELKITDRRELYMFFTAICHRFLPSPPVMQGDIFTVFRILIQYHEPELSSFLDTHRISTDMFSHDWFSSLLASQLQHDVLVQLWDITFLDSDPFLIMFLALVVVLNLRETLLELRGADSSLIISKIRAILPQLTSDDLEDFYTLSQHLVSKTPRSMSAKFAPILFGNAPKDTETQNLLESLCLPITVHELLDSKNADSIHDHVRFFLVDCRPADQYNAGHLPSAYFLDAGLLLSSPGEEFQTSVIALLATQAQALESQSLSAGEHVCFLGSGSEEEDRLVHMVVAQFLRRQTKHVGMVCGGYRAVHEVLGPRCDQLLASHDVGACCVCQGSLPGEEEREIAMVAPAEGEGRTVGRLVSRVQAALRVGGARVRERVAGVVGASEKRGPASRTYRDTGNVFSIEDDGGDELVCGVTSQGPPPPAPELINLDLWARRPDVIRVFQGYVVDENGGLNPGSLLLTGTHLFVLLASQALSPGMAAIHRRRSLAAVVKITSKKRLPECLTFHFQVGGAVERDRYVLEEAGDAARIIKIQIQKVLDDIDNEEP